MGGKYRHFKGHVYQVLCVAKNSEDLSEMVIYKNVTSGETWARPKDMFLDTVQLEGKEIPRFSPID